ncbi:MAG: hypothetical protein ACR2OU_09340 [Thermomicrobiales bacterium]
MLSQDIETIFGSWWYPNDPDKLLPGNLIRKSVADWELELLSSFTENANENAEVIHGEARGEFYTLLNCRRTSARVCMANSVSSTEVWSIRDGLKGIHLQSNETPIRTVSLSIEGAQDWTQITGLRKQYSQTVGQDKLDYLYERKQPEDVFQAVGSISVKFRSVVSSKSKLWEASLQEDTQIILESSEPMTLQKWKMEVIRPLQALIQFATRNGGSVQRVAILPPDEDKTGEFEADRRWMAWTGHWMIDYPYVPDRRGFERNLFSLKDMLASVGSLESWFGLVKRLRSPLLDYLDLSLGSVSMEYQYFIASRLLERLLGRKAQSINKLEEFIAKWMDLMPFPKSTPSMLKDIATLMHDTRNCIAHHRLAECERAASGSDLANLMDFTSILVDCEIASQIGLPRATVPTAVIDSRRLRRAALMVQRFSINKNEPTIF